MGRKGSIECKKINLILTHLGRGHQVHFEEPRLQGPLRGPVVLQRVEEERGALLHHVLLHEDVHDLGDLCERLIILQYDIFMK